MGPGGDGGAANSGETELTKLDTPKSEGESGESLYENLKNRPDLPISGSTKTTLTRAELRNAKRRVENNV